MLNTKWRGYSYDQKIIESIPALSDAVFPVSSLNEDGIISAQEDAFEEVVMFVLQNPEKNSAFFLDVFSKEKFYAVSKEHNQALAQFLSDLSWYFPATARSHVHELKRTLSLISI